MDRSIMTVYLRPNNLDKFEENPESNFMRFDTQAMLNSEFGKFYYAEIRRVYPYSSPCLQ